MLCRFSCEIEVVLLQSFAVKIICLPVKRGVVAFIMDVTGRNLGTDDDIDRGFFRLCVLRVVFCSVDGLRLSLSFFLSFVPSPFGPVGSLWRGAVVVRGHLGYILGFPMWVCILRRVFRTLLLLTLLAAGNIVHSIVASQQSVCLVCGNAVSPRLRV